MCSWGLSLIRPVTDCSLCGFHVLGGSNTGGNLLFLLFLFCFVLFWFFPGKFFRYQRDNVSYNHFSAHVHHLAQGKSEVASRLCPAAKHFHWGKKISLNKNWVPLGIRQSLLGEAGTGTRSQV